MTSAVRTSEPLLEIPLDSDVSADPVLLPTHSEAQLSPDRQTDRQTGSVIVTSGYKHHRLSPPHTKTNRVAST